MVNRIVVGLDGSDLSLEAFAYASMISAAGRIPIHIVHVVEGVPAPTVGTGSRDDVFHITEAIQSCEASSKWRGVDLTTEVVEGNVVEHFTSSTRPSDLLVVGLKGRFARVGLGSTTHWLVSHLQRPIMVVAGSSDRVLNRLITVYDGTPASAEAIEFARSLRKQLQWPMTALAVPGKGHRLDDVLAEAQNLDPEAQVITFDLAGRKPAQLIEDVFAEARHALLVLGAYGESWFRQALRGGTTGHVLTHIRGPVIMVPRVA